MKTPALILSLVFAAALAAPIQAATATATVGQAVTISVTSDGTPPLAYQWMKNGANIAGATAATLTFAAVQLADAATYTVRVSNTAGAVVSDNAVLSVNPAPPTKAVTGFTVGTGAASLTAPAVR